jgi:myo-inositol 2-dehydrogenase/D-chiro-inositol 1-dehydrogenase
MIKREPTDRRAFLKGAGALGFPAVLRGAQEAKAITVGLVGCGGRGTGAAGQALKADDYAQLTAMADIDASRIDASLARLQRTAADKIKVASDKKFIGLDAYQKLIDSGVDVVLLATPPGFRPEHLRYAIEQGKHVFCEKPISVDAPGVRSVLETAELAEKKGVSLVCGFCWRSANQIRAAMEQVHNGAIGDVVAYYATYYTSPVKPMPPESTRPEGMSDVEWQIRNWYNFCWTCGDSIVEQAVHSADKIAWMMRDQPPASCVAVGGRQIPANGGNIYDHFEVNYLYPNGVRAFLASRQIAGCHNENSDYVLGTKGSLTIERGMPKITGQTEWSYDGPRNDMYQTEHDRLFASIRQGKPINEGKWMATSTMLAMMGRMAAYTGQQITWDMAMQAQEKIFPEKLDWKGSLPAAPMPMPGKTKFV